MSSPKALEIYRAARGAVHKFFYSPTAESSDQLLQVVRGTPSSVWFIRWVTLFNATGGVAVMFACAAFLLRSWSDCDLCNRPLRWWLLVQALLQAAHFPVRCAVLKSLQTAEADEELMLTRLASLTASPAWCVSKVVALMLYVWYILGVIWWTHVGTCTGCPGIMQLIGGILFLHTARTIIVLAAFRMLLTDDRGTDPPVTSIVQAATQVQIRALPLIKVSSMDVKPQGGSCAVCLGDFRPEEFLRELPCRHHFHRRCVDRWLSRNKRCPLCIRAIDEAVCSAPWGAWARGGCTSFAWRRQHSAHHRNVNHTVG